MSEVECHENYPIQIVILSNFMSLSIYGIGAYILASLFVWLIIPYLLYVLWLEARVLRRSCVNCYYYGKVCAFGKGKLCALFFKKGNPQNFAADKITWVQLLPDFLVSLIPIAVGVFIAVTDFSALYLVLLLILIALSFGGNAIVRGNFACKYCKQREIGCPAEKLFGKEKA
ncbi:MAG: hypothetical protein HOC20_13220 [Chloroflexi bacterium]|jgi:hypothetical protein|nr:hypothetical protein [Chloroflexota bacterium]